MANPTEHPCWETLGLAAHVRAGGLITENAIRAAWQSKVAAAHPNTGKVHELVMARNDALRLLERAAKQPGKPVEATVELPDCTMRITLPGAETPRIVYINGVQFLPQQ